MMNRIVTFLFVLVAMSSCKKDAPEIEIEKSTMELLTNLSSKTWIVKDGVAKQNGFEVNLIASQNPCITDNRIKLFSDFSYEFTEGPTKCDPNNPDLILQANWALSADENTLTIEKFIFLEKIVDQPTFLLTTLTEDTFSGTTTIVLSGESFDVEVTFEAVAN